jgi:phosphoglycerate dehydrogenase-like enzyme
VLEALRPSAFFVNIGRGETVDERALIDVLRQRRIAGAGLDVFATEPLPVDSPFWDLPNVFLTPHIGGRFDEYEDYAMPLLTENMRLFLAGRPEEMRNRVAR